MRDEGTSDGDDDERSGAMPPVYQDPEGELDPDSFTTFDLAADGENFAVRLVVDPATGCTDTGYTWLSGRNEGYGFGSAGPPNPSLDDHRQRIRAFLAMVDPVTGHIEDD